MKFGICGYGNIGKAVEKLIIESGEDEIVGIFSRRKIKSEFSPTYSYEEAKNFEMDAMLMCGGSQEDLLWQSPEMVEKFNIVDSFDTHKKISEHKNNLDKIAKRTNHVAIYSCGWDPGLFSIIRALSYSIFKNRPLTFWGKGVSQGHSEALRNILGVKDAIQFTLPNKEVLKRVAELNYTPKESEMHERHCYVCPDKTRSEKEIETDILNTENYFKGQKVIVNFCNMKKINQLKKKMYHRGLVVGKNLEAMMEFKVKMQSNPNFTAQIMLAYAHAIKNLSAGAYSVLDIPLSLLNEQNFNLI